MIAWTVDVGYVSGEPTDLNSFVITDTKRPYTIFTPPSLEVFNHTFPSPNGEQAAYDDIKSIILSDIDLWYSIPIKMPNEEQLLRVKEFIPSINLAYPNLWEYYKTSDGPNYFIHFISFKKYVTQKGGTCYIIDDDGSVLASTAFGLSFCNLSTGVGILYNLAIKDYVNGMDLSSNNNWYEISITFNTGRSTGTTSSRKLNSSYDILFSTLFSNYTPPDWEGDPSNPFEPINPSSPGGGGGTFDDESDLIPDSSLPTLSSANTGFTRIYNPTLSQVQDLARYLWTDETLIQTLWNKIKQYFEDPMQAIIGFNLVPVPVPDAGSKNFALMYIDTGVSMNVAASQFVDRDCGTIALEPFYGSALDYSPYTKVSAFLPYIGNVQLNVDEVMGRTLQVKYRVDICSGSCVAKILVEGNVLYQYSGHCAINIPFAASDFSSYVQAAISVAKLGVGAAVAAAGGPPPVGVMDPSQQTNQVVTTTQTTETARNPMTGRQITTGTRTTVETREAPASQGSTQASFSALSPANVSNTVGQIMSSKPVVNHAGSFSGNTGYLGVRRPYLIIERPNLCMPEQFQTMNGYPSMITMQLSTCKGYTRVQQVQLTGLTATNPEQAEIQELLKSGVIF